MALPNYNIIHTDDDLAEQIIKLKNNYSEIKILVPLSYMTYDFTINNGKLLLDVCVNNSCTKINDIEINTSKALEVFDHITECYKEQQSNKLNIIRKQLREMKIDSCLEQK